MKRQLLLKLCIPLLVFSCAQRTDSENETTAEFRPAGFHFQPKHGKENRPISMFNTGGLYHLTYTTGSNEWGRATSTDLIQWKTTSSINLPDDVNGDLFIDTQNTLRLSDSTQVWVAVYNDNGIKGRYSLEGEEWNSFELDIPKEIEGTPKISWYELERVWILTVAYEQQIAILSSPDLREWTLMSQYSVEEPIETAELHPLGDRWIMFFNASGNYYQIGDFDGADFSPAKNIQKLNVSNSTLWSDASSIGDRLLYISAINGNLFTIVQQVNVNKITFNEYLLSFFPAQELNTSIIAKKRSKLKLITGDKTSWFTFTIDSLESSLEIQASNDKAEFAVIGIDNTKLSLENSNGQKENFNLPSDFKLPKENIQVDMLVDYNTIELFFSKGAYQAIFYVDPTNIYDYISVKTDGRSYDARAILNVIRVEEP